MRINPDNVTFEGDDIPNIVAKRTTIGTLADELRRRHCIVIYPEDQIGQLVRELAKLGVSGTSHLRIDNAELVDVEPDGDFDKWMQIRTEMDRFDAYSSTTYSGRIDNLAKVISSLIDLLQPPSVREART